MEIGEFGLIERIAGKISAGAGVAIGIGDDAAAVEVSSGRLSLVSTDMLVEGVHFDLSFCDSLTLGRKALAVNLSDIAAMGGEPRHFLLSLAVPRTTTLEFIDTCIMGMLQRAEEFGLTLIGGDTCASPDRLVLSVTVLGEQSAGKIVRRSGARPGDCICVTGTVGDSALGLLLLKKGEREGTVIARHLDPAPRVREGKALAEASLPSAMIDVSDGLLADLGHILDSSAVGVVVCRDALPVSSRFREYFVDWTDESLSLALAGGEDYELLFTVSPERVSSVCSLLDGFGTPVSVIGSITAEPGLSVVDKDGARLSCQKKGFDHFSPNA